jgi:hypothetical protein
MEVKLARASNSLRPISGRVNATRPPHAELSPVNVDQLVRSRVALDLRNGESTTPGALIHPKPSAVVIGPRTLHFWRRLPLQLAIRTSMFWGSGVWMSVSSRAGDQPIHRATAARVRGLLRT